VKAIGYIRVSTGKQAERGFSLDAQRAKLAGYATAYGLELLDIYEDQISGSKSKRPALAAALADMRERGDGLLVVKLDRLTRSVVHLGELLQTFQDYQLWSVMDHIDTRTSAGRLMLNLLTSVSQWEREAIGERTKAVFDYKREKGERIGHVPYGEQLACDGVHVEPCQDELDVIDLIRDYRERSRSWASIARYLNQAGSRRRTGTMWTKGATYKIGKRVGIE